MSDTDSDASKNNEQSRNVSPSPLYHTPLSTPLLSPLSSSSPQPTHNATSQRQHDNNLEQRAKRESGGFILIAADENDDYNYEELSARTFDHDLEYLADDEDDEDEDHDGTASPIIIGFDLARPASPPRAFEQPDNEYPQLPPPAMPLPRARTFFHQQHHHDPAADADYPPPPSPRTPSPVSFGQRAYSTTSYSSDEDEEQHAVPSPSRPPSPLALPPPARRSRAMSFVMLSPTEVDAIRQQERAERYFARVTDASATGFAAEVLHAAASTIVRGVRETLAERVGVTEEEPDPRKCGCPCWNYPGGGWRHCPFWSHRVREAGRRGIVLVEEERKEKD